MKLEKVKIGQTVKVVGSELFSYNHVGKIGVVYAVKGHNVYVGFTDGDSDYGHALDLKKVKKHKKPKKQRNWTNNS